MMAFTIFPYQSVGAVRFGMTPDQTETIVGKPERVKRSRFSAESTLFFCDGNLQLTFDEKTLALRSMTLYPGIKGLYLGELNLFEPDSALVINALTKADTQIRYRAGFTYFFTFGIAVKGFRGDEDDEDDRSVDVFDKTYWDIGEANFLMKPPLK